MMFVFKRSADEFDWPAQPYDQIPVYAIDAQTVTTKAGKDRPEVGYLASARPGDVISGGLQIGEDECVVAGQQCVGIKPPPAPTPEQCSSKASIQFAGRTLTAAWYPQMGGSGSACLIEKDSSGCFDVWVWHDGEFPFGEGDEREPAFLHHCDPEQFIRFGELVRSIK
jgi:hypothetical protein